MQNDNIPNNSQPALGDDVVMPNGGPGLSSNNANPSAPSSPLDASALHLPSTIGINNSNNTVASSNNPLISPSNTISQSANAQPPVANIATDTPVADNNIPRFTPPSAPINGSITVDGVDTTPLPSMDTNVSGTINTLTSNIPTPDATVPLTVSPLDTTTPVAESKGDISSIISSANTEIGSNNIPNPVPDNQSPSLSPANVSSNSSSINTPPVFTDTPLVNNPVDTNTVPIQMSNTSSSTSQNNSMPPVNMADKVMEDFCDTLLAEKGYNSIDPVQREAYKTSLMDELEDLTNTTIVNALDDQHLEEFESKLDAGMGPDELMNYVTSIVPNITNILSEAYAVYRQEYLKSN